ncbi:MAG: GNAT family N-acetyltransferase [Prevotella sp.]|nr:GNAT family N-acetyltransferase [Prevotella sp.]
MEKTKDFFCFLHKLHYLCFVNGELTIQIIEQSQHLPPMENKHFFHGPEYFRILEKTRGQTPYMVVARRGERVVGNMLASLRRRGSLIPPYLFTQGRIYGEGEFSEGEDRELLFSKMLEAITKKFQRKICLYIEFSNLSQKMFGYRFFRQQGYFPVHWMEVHNSLHSREPEERLSENMIERIARITEAGVEVNAVEDFDQFREFHRMLYRFFTLKVRRYLPPERLFAELLKSRQARLFCTKYHDRTIGGCACVYDKENAYLWYMGSKRKSHPKLHPETATVWAAIQDAYQRHYRHFRFMDVGLPFRHNPYRDFILSFGGKEVSTYRWFRFSFSWLNRLIGWFYRE